MMLDRIAILAAVVAALLLAERFVAARAPVRGRRWALNLGLGAANFLLGVLLSALFAVAAATWAAEAGFGLFNWADAPMWLAAPLAVVLLDLAVYWQHRALHAVPFLWPLHRLHHRDAAMDLTTGVRFHPGEIVVSGFWKAGVAALLGAPVAAVVIFEVILAVASLWEHTNLRLPARADGLLRRVLVTPAMHLVHHGADGDDMRHNYGFSTSLWDRLFRSYRESPTSTRLGCE
jgi:sterol desaturase/sphingolipid hydroxylase (fatty acid hydroxylase superfamily)